MSESVKDSIIKLLDGEDGDEIRELLERIVEWEKKNPPRNEYDGFYWYEVYGDPRVLNKLVTRRVLKIVLKTNSGTAYRLVDLNATEEALKEYDKLRRSTTDEHVEIPDNLFDVVIGHEDKKDIIIRALRSPKRVHLLLYGSPASAKSLILECISSLPGSKMVIGSSSTKAGLFELLYSEEPKYLIIDEIDKIESPQDLAILLSLMETGRISETKFGRRRYKILNTKVVAAANKIDNIPPELLSRFIKLKFREYTPDEFLEVSRKVLTMREGLNDEIANYIANQVLRKLNSRDVRDCIKVARLINNHTKEEVDKVIELMRKQI